MLTFKEYNATLEEGSGLEFLSLFVPRALLNLVKKSANRTKYIKAADIYKQIINDKSRSVSKNDAIKKAAGTVGVSVRDLAKILHNAPIGGIA